MTTCPQIVEELIYDIQPLGTYSITAEDDVTGTRRIYLRDSNGRHMDTGITKTFLTFKEAKDFLLKVVRAHLSDSIKEYKRKTEIATETLEKLTLPSHVLDQFDLNASSEDCD